MKVIELRNLYFSYNDRVILEDINLTVKKREYLALIGPNGSGKTTLVKLILGLLPPVCGEVLVFGTSLQQFKDWYRLGYVPQRAVLNNGFPVTVREVAAAGRFGRVGLCRNLKREDWEAVEEALDMVGLLSLQHKPLLELSGGQQQRVFIARALAGQPDILILDEPQVGLDDRYLHDFYCLLKHLKEERGITIFIVSHDIAEIGSWADRIICLNKKVLYQGTPREVLTPSKLNDLYGMKLYAAN
ncbi:MAG TPA: metal ABC transporter ATP-binding protein [Syntrophomonadaceae bacterium]|nr:metal ABC transporter ATP-binding protein [Syntrophomonadaceae bacterium]